MSTTAVSALSAVLFAALLVPLAFIPYVAWAYRRGSSGPGHALMTLSALLYGCALWTFTIVPLPELSDLICDGTVRIGGSHSPSSAMLAGAPARLGSYGMRPSAKSC